jgi:hypothetical protein
MVGTATNPLIVWLLTAAGGTFIYLRLIRRREDDDDEAGGLVLATATGAPGGHPRPNTPSVAAGSVAAGAAAATPPVVTTRTFDASPGKGVERATVAYHKVRISSKPDAVRSVELGRLDRGDEVEILDSYEGFLQVRTPDDVVGWILRHTIVGAPS